MGTSPRPISTANGIEPGMAARVAAYDWSATPLGPLDQWPETLKAALQIVMHSRFPMFIWWGPQLINIYNDAYIPMLGEKHPSKLAQPAAAVWHEIWDVVGPQTDLVLNHRKSTWNDEMLLLMDRHGYTEETYFTFSYSPIGGGEAAAEGLFCAVTEDTSRVIGRRRLKTLRELATETANLGTGPEAFAAAAAVLRRNPYDIPFALLYEVDAEENLARLAATSGVDESRCGAPVRFGLDRDANPWHLDLRSDEIRIIEDLDKYFAQAPKGPWPARPHEALLMPFTRGAETSSVGFMVAGISPYIRLDEEYRGFLALAAGHIATALGNSRAYEAERRRAEALAEIDRAKTTFFSNVSHEFRTPLTLMIGPLEEMLAESGALAARNRERLDTAHRNSLRLLKLVNTLLDFARIEAGRIQAAYEPVDLAALTQDVASVFRSAVEVAGLKLIIDTPPLPESVYVDAEMWEKIVLNLLSNAFKFTFEGEIRVSLRAEDGVVRFVVSDTGTGIPAEEIPRLFERFHRVKGARGRSFEGSGIGLALIQELVKLHGGSVQVESELNRGTRFTVTIPLGKTHLPADRIGTAVSRQSAAARNEAFLEEALRWLPESGDPQIASGLEPAQPRLAGPSAAPRSRIVIADDNADMRAYAARLLGRDYAVTVAADGEAALEAIRANPPDLVLTDVMMPRLDGFGLVRALRRDPRTREIPVILLTARAGEEERIEGLETGADEYLTKPFSARELLARVQASLKLQRVRNESNRALRESEHRYRTLFNSMDEGFCTIEVLFDENRHPVDYRFLEVNAAFEKQTGIQSAGGKRMREIAPAHEDNWFEIYGRIAQTGQPERFENEARQLGRWYDGYAFRLGPPEFHQVGIIFNDITERRRREEQLRQANNDLEQFAYSASHDLQEPIRTVTIYSELLAKRYREKLEGDALQFLEYIHAGGERMGLLVRDLLTYTRVIKLEAEPEIADSSEAFRVALSNLDAAVRASDARIEAGPLPAVVAHPMHLQQLFQNLVGNAIKYRSKERTPVVDVTAEQREGQWLFSVSDNGIGIAPEFRDKVFGLFKRLHSGNEYSGTGLGLAICQRIVERYGGRIWVESRAGEGSTFRFTLPVL
ncbi:MAG TPA: ATP-binding protein [Bryobacteraceae bacterium]|nr:ATP-binding protein [Bryobacteraceae bacterium]